MDVTIYEFSVTTTCLLCFKNEEKLFEINGEEGNELNVELVLSKHFWFQPVDLENRQICLKCWSKLEDFHKFYLDVENVYINVIKTNDGEYLEQAIEEQKTIPIIAVENHSNEFLIETIEFNEELAPLVDVVKPDEDENEESDEKTFTKRSQKETEIEDELIKEHCALRCDLCDQQFQNFNQIKRHIRSDHNQQGYVTCCGRKFIKRIRLLEHVARHFDPKAYKCLICEKTYANSQGLKLHNMTAHEPVENRPYKCDKCDKSFSKLYILKGHQVHHVEEKDKTVSCDSCDKVFANRTLMRTHYRTKHLKTDDHICDICAKSFKVKSIFEKHRKEHDESQQTKVQCKICEAWLKNLGSLRKHMQRHNDELHYCDICGKQAPNKLALKSHKNFVHKAEKLHKCGYCEKAFKRAFTLKEHLTTHTGDVLYHCQFCPKTFNSSANMLAHRKKIHPKQWSEIQKQKLLSNT